MSFILDALKKSENERKRTLGPSLADAPVRRMQAERPWWAFAVAGLLVVNLGVLVVVLTRKDTDDAQPVVATAPLSNPAPAAPARIDAPRTATVPQLAPPITRSASNNNFAVRSLAEEAATAESDAQYEEDFAASENPALASAADVPDGPPIVRPIDAPAVAPLQSRPVPSGEQLPTLSSLTANGASMPDLHLDIHVYSNKPAERFIFVNMRKYLEGQTLSEGPAVERITPDGAVLNQQGVRFLLPRQ